MHVLHTRQNSQRKPVIGWAEFCQYLVKFCFTTPKNRSLRRGRIIKGDIPPSVISNNFPIRQCNVSDSSATSIPRWNKKSYVSQSRRFFFNEIIFIIIIVSCTTRLLLFQRLENRGSIIHHHHLLLVGQPWSGPACPDPLSRHYLHLRNKSYRSWISMLWIIIIFFTSLGVALLAPILYAASTTGALQAFFTKLCL